MSASASSRPTPERWELSSRSPASPGRRGSRASSRLAPDRPRPVDLVGSIPHAANRLPAARRRPDTRLARPAPVIVSARRRRANPAVSWPRPPRRAANILNRLRAARDDPHPPSVPALVPETRRVRSHRQPTRWIREVECRERFPAIRAECCGESANGRDPLFPRKARIPLTPPPDWARGSEVPCLPHS